MKKIIITIFVLVMVLCSCGTEKDNAADDKAAVISDELTGMYYDQIAGRGMLELTKTDDSNALIDIRWSNTAAENAHWTMNVSLQGNNLTYSDGTYTIETYDSSGNHSDEEVYKDGTGYFEISEGMLTWHNDKDELGNQDTVFVRDYLRDETTGIPNPWTYTTDLEEAISVSNVDFMPPVTEALPGNVSLNTYMSTAGTISAVYAGPDNELVIRKSTDLSGRELSGDYNAYSKTWTHSFKGLRVAFEGDGELANLATFSVGDTNFSITYNMGQEGRGLSMDEINSLVNGMQ